MCMCCCVSSRWSYIPLLHCVCRHRAVSIRQCTHAHLCALYTRVRAVQSAGECRVVEWMHKSGVASATPCHNLSRLAQWPGRVCTHVCTQASEDLVGVTQRKCVHTINSSLLIIINNVLIIINTHPHPLLVWARGQEGTGVVDAGVIRLCNVSPRTVGGWPVCCCSPLSCFRRVGWESVAALV